MKKFKFLKKNVLFRNILVKFSFLILSFGILIVALIYAFLPYFYEKLAISQLEYEASILTDNSYTSTEMVLKDISVQYVIVYVQDENGKWLALNDPIEKYRNFDDNAVVKDITVIINNQEETIKLVKFLNISDDIRHSIMLALPYVVIISLVVTFVTSYIFSKSITDPLIKINQKVNALAKLDFDTKIDILRDDEIGEVSDNLDIVSVELKTALDKLNNDVFEAMEKDRERRLFMSAMSHELKTPIMVLKGQTEAMQDNIGMYKDRDKYLGENLKMLIEMESLVSQILYSARLEDSISSENFELINLNTIVQDGIKTLDYVFTQKNQVVTLVDENTFNFIGDYNTIKVMIKNLLENAVNYSQSNEIHVLINENKLTVSNFNTDFPSNKNEINRLLKPFERLDVSRNKGTGGHGLGLYIIDRSCRVNNLKLEIENDNGIVKFIITKNND